MSLPASIPAAILETILGRLACLFLAATTDPQAARQAALHLLESYNIQTEQELTLAAEVISFSLHSLEALSLATTPDLPLNKAIRLRGAAVSLNRESHRSRNKLEQIQSTQTRQPEATTPSDKAEKAVELVEIAREAIEIASKQKKGGKYGGLTWTQDYQKRATAKRMAENAQRKAAADLAKMQQPDLAAAV